MTESAFGRRLKLLLEEREMTQVQLARLLHLGKSTVSQYISGHRSPDLETAAKVAELFSVSVDYLLGRTEIRWPAVIKEPDVELIVSRFAGLTADDRQKLLDYMEYLRFERRRKETAPAPLGDRKGEESPP